MKKSVHFLAVLCALALSVTTPAQAALIVDESYQGYAVGAVGNNTISGNATGISTANLLLITGGTLNTATITSGTMSYSNGSLSLNGGNQYLNMSGTNAGSTMLAGTLATSRTVAGGSFYMSFLHRFNGAFASGDIGYTTLQLTPSGFPSTTGMLTGNNGSSIRTVVNNTTSTTAAISSGAVNFVMVQYLTDGVNWTGANVWVNPNSSTLGAATYTLASTGSSSSWTAIAPLINGLDAGDSVDFDRLQIGTSAGDVIPEPSTWLLLAGAGTFFMVMRRRRTDV